MPPFSVAVATNASALSLPMRHSSLSIVLLASSPASCIPSWIRTNHSPYCHRPMRHSVFCRCQPSWQRMRENTCGHSTRPSKTRRPRTTRRRSIVRDIRRRPSRATVHRCRSIPLQLNTYPSRSPSSSCTVNRGRSRRGFTSGVSRMPTTMRSLDNAT